MPGIVAEEVNGQRSHYQEQPGCPTQETEWERDQGGQELAGQLVQPGQGFCDGWAHLPRLSRPKEERYGANIAEGWPKEHHGQARYQCSEPARRYRSHTLKAAQSVPN